MFKTLEIRHIYGHGVYTDKYNKLYGIYIMEIDINETNQRHVVRE